MMRGTHAAASGRDESSKSILEGSYNNDYGLLNTGGSNLGGGHDEDVRERENDQEIHNEKIPRHVYVLAGCGGLNMCNLGFDIGVNTGAGVLVQEAMQLSDLQLGLFMGFLNFSSIIGALLSSRIVGRYGLRTSFLVSAVGFLFGILVMVFSRNYHWLMFGRMFVGVGVGFGMTIGPMYISEISPKQQRGSLVSWSEVGCNLGILLGFVVGFFFSSLPADTAWRCMFATGLVMPLILILLTVWIMSESPRWLIQNRKEHEALQVLTRLHPPGCNIEEELEEIKEALEQERQVNDRVGWSAIFCPCPAVRQMLIVGIGMALAQQLSGIDAIQYYLVFIMEEAGIQGRAQQTMFLTGLGILKLACIFVGASLLDRLGRRPLMFLSLSGVIGALLLIASTFFATKDRHAVVVFGLAVYLAFFSLGMGPLTWVIPSEVYSTSIRAKAMSLTFFVNRGIATIVTSTMLSVANLLTWGGFFVALAVSCTLILLFMVVYQPETKGKSLEQVTAYFVELTQDKSGAALLLDDASVASSSASGSGAEDIVEIVGKERKESFQHTMV